MLANLHNCQPVNMLAYQSAYWLANLPTGLQICLPPYFPNCQNLLSTCITVFLPSDLTPCSAIYLSVDLPLNIAKTYQLACPPAYHLHTCLSAYQLVSIETTNDWYSIALLYIQLSHEFSHALSESQTLSGNRKTWMRQEAWSSTDIQPKQKQIFVQVLHKQNYAIV